MLKDKSESVKVVVRCRPLGQKEIQEQRECVVNVEMNHGTIAVCNPSNIKEIKSFTFDHTYDWHATQELIFNQTAKPILESVMEGYNGTIFAYGQTGTGKTYTMEGEDNQQEKGIIPRSIDWIFSNIKNYTNQQFLVRVSFVEIYNEEVRDLLSKVKRQKLNVREKDKVFYLEDVTIFQTENSQQTLEIMKKGRVNRATGATKMNPGSSRSHSIFSIIVESSTLDENNQAHYKVGKLNLVDLAGSERQSKTESTGERFKEATKINLSLTILGSVINKLVSGKTQYIPYRDSKLTMLLQDSLGGNTKTVMIANVGPADYNYDETLNTLWYASHAKKIKNKPRINEDPKDALLREYKEQIELMKKKLLAMGKGDLVMQISGKSTGNMIVNEENQIRQVLENLEKEKEDFNNQQKEAIQKIKEQKNLAEEEKNQLIDKIQKKIEENQKNKDESKSLLTKYKEMKKKVLKGGETEKKVKDQEREINKQREELEIKKREEERLKEDLEEKSKNNIQLKKRYESKQANIDDLNEKILQLRQQIEVKKNENKDLTERYNEENQNLRDNIKLIDIERKKYEFFIKTFIPIEEKERIDNSLEYNEKDNSYKINPKKAIYNNYKTNMGKLKEMKKNKLMNKKIPVIKDEHINLQLEQPDQFTKELTEQPEQDVLNDIDKIITDDDSDLVYFDKELHMQSNQVSAAIVGVPPNKIDSKNTTSDSLKFIKPKIKK